MVRLAHYLKKILIVGIEFPTSHAPMLTLSVGLHPYFIIYKYIYIEFSFRLMCLSPRRYGLRSVPHFFLLACCAKYFLTPLVELIWATNIHLLKSNWTMFSRMDKMGRQTNFTTLITRFRLTQVTTSLIRQILVLLRDNQ